MEYFYWEIKYFEITERKSLINFSILILKSMHLDYDASLRTRGDPGFNLFEKINLLQKVLYFPGIIFENRIWSCEIIQIARIIFLNVFVCDSGINDRLSLNLEGHSLAYDCFSSQCLCVSGLASTGLMCGWTRVRRGKG